MNNPEIELLLKKMPRGKLLVAPNKIKVREGYHSFIGLIWFLYKTNRVNKYLDCRTRYEIILPVRWI